MVDLQNNALMYKNVGGREKSTRPFNTVNKVRMSQRTYEGHDMMDAMSDVREIHEERATMENKRSNVIERE